MVKYSTQELAVIFPEASQVIKENIKVILLKLKELNEEAKEFLWYNQVIIGGQFGYWNLKAQLTIMDILPLEKRLKRLDWESSILDRKIKETDVVDIEALKSRYDLREVMEQWYGVKFKLRVGKNWSCCCPIHKERNPSCSVSSRVYYCFSCGESGDLITFISKTEKLNFKEVIKKLT